MEPFFQIAPFDDHSELLLVFENVEQLRLGHPLVLRDLFVDFLSPHHVVPPRDAMLGAQHVLHHPLVPLILVLDALVLLLFRGAHLVAERRLQEIDFAGPNQSLERLERARSNIDALGSYDILGSHDDRKCWGHVLRMGSRESYDQRDAIHVFGA